MSDLKPRGIAVTLGDVERHFLFTLNVIDELQEKYDKSMYEIINEMAQGESAVGVLKETVAALINREAKQSKGAMDEVTPDEVGEMIAMDNYQYVLYALLKAYGVSMPEPDDESDPN